MGGEHHPGCHVNFKMVLRTGTERLSHGPEARQQCQLTDSASSESQPQTVTSGGLIKSY
jgi:hypothetical protein